MSFRAFPATLLLLAVAPAQVPMLRTLDDVRALPAATTHVAIKNGSAEFLEALAERRALQRIDMPKPSHATPIDARGLRALAKLSSLRSLCLQIAPGVASHELKGLTALPMLDSLELRGSNWKGEGLGVLVSGQLDDEHKRLLQRQKEIRDNLLPQALALVESLREEDDLLKKRDKDIDKNIGDLNRLSLENPP